MCKKIYTKPVLETICTKMNSSMLAASETGQSDEGLAKHHRFAFDDEDDYPQNATSSNGFSSYSAWDDDL